MQAIKILVTNQKGGVGKSTIAANLAAYLAIQHSLRVNLIDFDRQSSSSKWIKRAPDIGLEVHQANLPYESTGSLVLAEARRCLNKFSVACDLSVSDLTWTYAMSPEFMLEYDMILIPSATSKFEMASSEIFILEYIQKHLYHIKNRKQTILMVPSRVDRQFQPEQTFLNLQSVDQCQIAPPIYWIPAIDDFVYEDFLCVSTNAEVAHNFSAFGGFVAKLVTEQILAKKANKDADHVIKRASNVSILDKYRSSQSEMLQNSDNFVENPVPSDEPRFSWIPQFLVKK